MKQSFLRKPLSILLSLLMALSVFAGLQALPQAQAYNVGDKITFGAYPQTRVTDETLIAALDAAEKTWTSYRYYSGTGSSEYDGQMEPGDWMRFADFFYAGEKYRAVTFELYRPRWLYWKAEASGRYVTMYNDTYKNGYRNNNVYYFKYEPLVWRVLDPQSGLVLTENIIDSQSFSNVVYDNPDDQKSYRRIDSTVFSNDYTESDLRVWMNSSFFATAFSDAQKAAILATDVETNLTNKIFFLSMKQAERIGSNTERLAYGTDYAKSQGLYVNGGGEGVGASPWSTRTPYGSSGKEIYQVTLTLGQLVTSDSPVRSTSWGVRLACCLETLKQDDTVSEFLLSEHLAAGHTPGEPVAENIVDATCVEEGSYISTVYCSVCGGELSREPKTIPATGVHDWQWWTDREYTCFSDGVKHQYCTMCGQKQNEGTPIPAAHRFNEWIDAVPPTCSKDGTLGYQSCIVCGDNYDADGNLLESIIDPATGNHVYEDAEWTYYNAEQHVRFCTVCEEAPQFEDHEVIYRGAVAPTCVKEGCTGEKFCAVCGEKLADNEIIPATGIHTTELVGAVAATATENGYTGDEICTVCGQTVKTGEVIPAFGEDTPAEPESGVCRYCGETHNKKTVSGWWTSLIHDILYVLNRLFLWLK